MTLKCQLCMRRQKFQEKEDHGKIIVELNYSIEGLIFLQSCFQTSSLQPNKYSIMLQ
jgi:hypothetical protein